HVSVNNSDTTPPTVSITSPTDGATVSNTITVSANASDNVGVTGVQFFLDGNALGNEDTSSPYSVSWDTTTAANGTHTMTARARDAANNATTSTSVSVTASNATDPSVIGQFGSVINMPTNPVTGTPIVAMNMVLLDNGKILLWDGGPDCLGAVSPTVWDP